MKNPFEEITLRDIQAWVKKKIHPLLTSNRAFYEGDHWQEGEGWIGPAPRGGEVGYHETMRIIHRGFASKNVVAEVTERHASGVVGQESSWGLSPADETDSEDEALLDEIAERERMLTAWWDRNRVPGLFARAVATLLYAERASLRLYIPPGFVEEAEDGSTVLISPASYEEALDMIFIDHPAPEVATVHTDPDTKKDISIFMYKRDRKDYVSLSYLDDNKQMTILRVVSREKDVMFDPLDLGGKLMMFEMERPLLITEQVQQAQRAINLAISSIPRTVVTAGWLERTLLNAQMPGRWVKDPDTGEETFYPSPYQAGPNTTNFVQGVSYTDETGKTIVTNPSIHHRDPVPATSSIEAKEAHYKDILEEADQPHILMSSDATASGRSRIEARGDYLNSLRITKPMVEAAGRWLIETVNALAEELSGADSLRERTRGVFRTRLDVGQLSPEEQKVIMERVEKGMVPKEWAMEMMGVDDVDAAIDLIDNRPDSRLERTAKRLENMKLATDVGMGMKKAATLVGFEEEELDIITAPEDPMDGLEVIEQ